MTNYPPFSLPQTAFMLSLGSNYLFDKTADDTTLLKDIQAYLGTPQGGSSFFFNILNTPSPNYQCLAFGGTATAGDWKTVWGPAVFRAPYNPGATNAVYVAYSANQNVYVVAIAGTNPTGDSALLFQDLDVNPAHMVAWPPQIVKSETAPWTLKWTDSPNPNPPTSVAAIDLGTSQGLTALFNLPGDGASSSTSQLLPYLQSVANSNATLIFTGHSLGGALSPMFGLLCYPNGASGSGWGNIYLLPTAGPTPGTAAVAALFKTNYPPVAVSYTPYKPTSGGAFAVFNYWNNNYSNQWDVVPRAWDNLTLGTADAPVANALVTQPALPKLEHWPSFFAASTPLEEITLGPSVYGMVSDMQTRAGYVALKNETPYYAPAVPHNTFTGQWGSWSWATNDPYPATWVPSDPVPPFKVLLFLKGLTPPGGLIPWILNAHLDQYPYAFLGATAPKVPS